MNLVRLGHYFHPHEPGPEGELRGSCQTALVVGVDARHNTVNLQCWDSDGDQFKRLDVPVMDTYGAQHPPEGGDTFHLSADCPWRR